jgi:CHAD domain-containing protein
MPFRFKQSEFPAKALRRVCRERVDVALDCLRRPGHPAAVHGARKEIKKLRALFRLMRGGMSAGAYRKGVKALRAAADCLAATRDARVMLKAFHKLAGPAAPKFAGLERALEKHARRESRRFRRDHSVAEAGRWLRKTHRRMDRLGLKLTGWAAMEPGLKLSYQRGRDACRLARRQPAAENFHAWRREVKDLWYYFCLLEPVCPAATRAAANALERLGERLGEDHDLFLLARFAAERADAEAEPVKVLERLIGARQRRLRAAALKLGARLYAEAPAAFCRRLGRWRR